MNSLLILLGSLISLAAGYIFYGRIVERIFEVDPKNVTAAYKYYDGIDYVPAKSWLVLFGHHFSSIAGAGPIVGPIIAVALWGWLPALLWIVLGAVFVGGIHDFASLMISIRHKATSVSNIAETVISKRAKLIFLSFVWFALILVIAVFTSVCAQTLTADKRTVIPCFGLIFIALLVGYLFYWRKTKTWIGTVIGLSLLLGCILMGDIFPVNIGGNAFIIWCIVLLVYSFIASVTPVQILLQPRDYLSSFLLYFGILMGVLGVVVMHPSINCPMFQKWSSIEGRWLWPMLFVTIACGANSGFHALIASGTTAKQLPNERFAKRIGYGGMALEGFLAVIAVLAVGAGIKAGGLNGMLIKGGAGPIGAFGQGYGNLTRTILFGKGALIAILLLNSFILATLDTATRIARYISEELFKINNRFFATFVVVFISGILVLTGKWNKIWPIFGASNQLVAALTFIVISSWLLQKKKRINFIIIPTVFMLLTSIGALLFQLTTFVRSKDFVLIAVDIALVILAGMMVWDVVKSLKSKIRISKI